MKNRSFILPALAICLAFSIAGPATRYVTGHYFGFLWDVKNATSEEIKIAIFLDHLDFYLWPVHYITPAVVNEFAAPIIANMFFFIALYFATNSLMRKENGLLKASTLVLGWVLLTGFAIGGFDIYSISLSALMAGLMVYALFVAIVRVNFNILNHENDERSKS